MKTLIQYIKESLINEGGKAVNGTPMTQPQVKAVYQDVIKKILEPKLGLTEEGVDYAPLGTFGKKKEDQTSGDLDIAISIERIAGYLGISVDMVGQAVQDILAETGVDFVFNPGTLVTSFAWPIPGTDKFGQVDFMPSDNMDYSEWMYHSPDFTKAESNYKGVFRNQLLMAIVHYAKEDIISKNDKDEVLEFERYSYRVATGVFNTRRSYLSNSRKNPDGTPKRNTTATRVKEYDKLVTNVPEEIIKIAFGEGVKRSQVMRFEDVYELVMSDNFIHKNKLNDIIKKYIQELISNEVEIPMIIMEDWPEFCEEIQTKHANRKRRVKKD